MYFCALPNTQCGWHKPKVWQTETDSICRTHSIYAHAHENVGHVFSVRGAGLVWLLLTDRERERLHNESSPRKTHP